MIASLGRLVGTLTGHWRIALFLALAAYAALLHLRLGEEKLHGAKLEARLTETSMLLDRERAEVRLRTAVAQAEDATHAARVERDQTRISKESLSDYQKDIAALHAADRGLRGTPAAAASSGSYIADLPGLSSSARRVDGAAREDSLLAGEALIASEIAVRLKALQQWIRRQQEVAPATAQAIETPVSGGAVADRRIGS